MLATSQFAKCLWTISEAGIPANKPTSKGFGMTSKPFPYSPHRTLKSGLGHFQMVVALLGSAKKTPYTWGIF